MHPFFQIFRGTTLCWWISVLKWAEHKEYEVFWIWRMFTSASSQFSFVTIRNMFFLLQLQYIKSIYLKSLTESQPKVNIVQFWKTWHHCTQLTAIYHYRVVPKLYNFSVLKTEFTPKIFHAIHQSFFHHY